MKKLIYVSMILFAITGCATTPVSTKEAQLVPTERIFRIEKLPAEGNTRVIFVRDIGLAGSAVYQNLFIDGRKAAALNPGEKIEFILPPGEHIFGVVPTDIFGTNALNSIDQDLKPGKSYYYRIMTDGNSLRSSVQRFFPNAE